MVRSYKAAERRQKPASSLRYLRRLEYAFAAAQHGSLRRAARALDVEESTLSRAIRALEGALGIELFQRARTGVLLTDAGGAFLTTASPALEAWKAAERNAEAAGRAERGLVRIGLVNPIMSEFVRRVLGDFTRDHGGVILEMHEGRSSEHLAAVETDRLDVAFIAELSSEMSSEHLELWCERLYLAMSSASALAQKSSIGWRDLADERVIVSTREFGPDLEHLLIAACRSRSTNLEVYSHDARQSLLMQRVARGNDVTVVPHTWVDRNALALSFRPLKYPYDVVRFSAVWSPRNDNPALRRLLSICRLAKARRRTGDPCFPTHGNLEPREERVHE